MSTWFRCPCGRRLRVSPTARAVDCPFCERTIVIPDRRPVWVLAVVAVLSLGLVGVIAAVKFRQPPAVAVADKPAPAPVPDPPRKPAERVRIEPNAPADPPAEPARPPKERPAEPPAPQPKEPAKEPPRVGRLEAVEPAGRYKEGDTFTQELLVTRQSAVGIASLGLAHTTKAQYLFTSELAVAKVNPDGSMTVAQTITGTKLLDADADSKDSLLDALKKAVGTKFELTVAPGGGVTALKGLDDPIRIKVGFDGEGGRSLRMWSLLDADAWKEFCGMTFLQPDQPLKKGAKWHRDAFHDWGQLGTWRGKTVYGVPGKNTKKAGVEWIDYVHDIYHKPAAGNGGDSPLAVGKASFPTVKAGGAILYDTNTRRVTTAEETFAVRGAVTAGFGGADAAIDVEEQQGFRLTVSEVMGRELNARPPGR